MALVSSGTISLADVNVELGRSSTAQISLGESAVRSLFAVGSGAINMANGYGKANEFAFTISSNQTNANLASLATAAGWSGASKLIATIGSGVYISSNSTGTPALTVSGSFPGGVTLTNNGTIVGMGGAGGQGQAGGTGGTNSAGTGGTGGTALSVSSPITITNNGTIAGGGGGGGGGAQGVKVDNWKGASGPGGGGGRSGLTNSAGGAGGPLWVGSIYTGAAGSAGTISGAGNGGGRSSWLYYSSTYYNGIGGNGGSWGASGSGGQNGYGGAGAFAFQPAAGGAGGNAVSGNSNITWVSTGTRYGTIG